MSDMKPPKPQWISSEDHLPVTEDPKGRAVLMYRQERTKQQSEFSVDIVYPGRDIGPWIRITNITHWCWVPDRPGKQGDLF